MRKDKSTKVEMEKFRSGVLATVQDNDPPMTVRHAFYLAVAGGLVDKSEKGYRYVQDAVRVLRLNDDLDWNEIVDNVRSVHVRPAWSSPGSILQGAAAGYRRDFWSGCDEGRGSEERPIIWVEKDAIAGLIQPVCDKWQVPLVVARGNPSVSLLHDVAENHVYPDTTIYHLTDYDGAGMSMSKGGFRKPGGLAHDLSAEHSCYVTVKRIAVTEQQIKKFKLPTRPPKSGDRAQYGFSSKYAVELDAMSGQQLRDVVEESIRHHVDPDRPEWQAHLAQEKLDRARLTAIAKRELKKAK